MITSGDLLCEMVKSILWEKNNKKQEKNKNFLSEKKKQNKKK